MQFLKYQALGNDYLVLDDLLPNQTLSPEQVKTICNRHFGIGADGILIGFKKEADYYLTIYNSDGTKAEKSGNGLRIFAHYLWDKNTHQENTFIIHTQSGPAKTEIIKKGTVKVQMGKLSFLSKDIPLLTKDQEALDQYLSINNNPIHFHAASIGNPHCMLILEKIDPELALHLGPALEKHLIFPNKTNVQFIQILDPHTIKIEIWERGSGYTLASGSSACACAGLCIKKGFTKSPVTVCMQGGKLLVEADENLILTQTGPVSLIAKIQYYPT